MKTIEVKALKYCYDDYGSLGDGLEEIGFLAFGIITPSIVGKVINGWTFMECMDLMTLQLGKGLEAIDERALIYSSYLITLWCGYEIEFLVSGESMPVCGITGHMNLMQ
jgi:hypothetical protein